MISLAHGESARHAVNDHFDPRAAVAVINAFLLAVADATSPIAVQSAGTKQALANLWKTQRADGPAKGSWAWLDFKLEPWESEHAEYWGATLAAIAAGIAPQSTADREAAAENIARLREYLRAGLDNPDVNLHHRTMLLLASQRLDGLLSREEQEKIAGELVDAQHDDGGWSMADLGQWKIEDEASDAYATGLCAYVLTQFDEAHYRAPAREGAYWLSRHQDPQTGAWPMASLNKKHDPDTMAGQFTQDAATAFAVLALSTIEW